MVAASSSDDGGAGLHPTAALIVRTLSDKLLLRLLAFGNAAAAIIEYDINTAPLLRACGRQVGRRAVFHGISAGPHVSINADARIDRGVRVGTGVRVGARAMIRAAAILGCGVEVGDRCVVGERARLENLRVGSDSTIEAEVLCVGQGEGTITIGRQSYIGLRNILDWSDTLVIGDFVHIAGPSTGIWTHSSAPQALNGDALNNKARRITRPVQVCDRVYIGGNCTIYPGVTIGTGSIVLPNTAVSADVEPHVMAGGVPARVIRRLEW